MNDQSRNAKDEAARTRRQLNRLRGRIERLERRYDRLRRWAIIAATPALVILSPIVIPIAVLRQVRRRSATSMAPAVASVQSPREIQHRTTPAQPSGQAQRTLVHDAFLLARDQGHDAALELLDAHANLVPAGGRAMFEALGAGNDDAWLAAMNRWTVARGLPRIQLAPGDRPRFHRISFEPVPSAAAPDLITVIVPCFNAESGVERAIDSILAQTWQNIEVIAVNDASSDATGSILDRLATKDRRLRVLQNARNVGPFVSKNRALGMASGRYVTGHDADDIAFPDWLATQMQPILNNAGIKATISVMVRLDEDGRFAFPARIGNVSHDGIERIAPISLLIERAVLLATLGAWNSVRFGSDTEMLTRTQDLLGDGLHEIRRATMLCLSSATGLTNHPDHGVNFQTGLSQTRLDYKASWRAWHERTAPGHRYLPFPPLGSPFPVPEIMRVPDEDILAVLAEDMPDPSSAMRRLHETTSAEG